MRDDGDVVSVGSLLPLFLKDIIPENGVRSVVFSQYPIYVFPSVPDTCVFSTRDCHTTNGYDNYSLNHAWICV